MENDEANLAAYGLYQVESVLASEPWKDEGQWLEEAAITYCAIHLNDVLAKLDAAGSRIDFVVGGSDDATKVVRDYRNAACHIPSKSRQATPEVYIAFSKMTGGMTLQFGDTTLTTPEDDVVYSYGQILLQRNGHLFRALAEAKAALIRIAEAKGYRLPLLTMER